MPSYLIDPCHERFAWKALSQLTGQVVLPFMAVVVAVALIQDDSVVEALRSTVAGWLMVALVTLSGAMFVGQYLMQWRKAGQWGRGWKAGLWAHALILALSVPLASGYGVLMDAASLVALSLTGS